jgi:uncharacterized membrane protein
VVLDRGWLLNSFQFHIFKFQNFKIFWRCYFILNYFSRGIASAKDSIASTFAVAGVVVTLLPIASIMYAIFERGKAGLNINLFTTDMK